MGKIVEGFPHQSQNKALKQDDLLPDRDQPPSHNLPVWCPMKHMIHWVRFWMLGMLLQRTQAKGSMGWRLIVARL